jgi:hypothetical protein
MNDRKFLRDTLDTAILFAIQQTMGWLLKHKAYRGILWKNLKTWSQIDGFFNALLNE